MPCPYACEAVGAVDIKAKALSYEVVPPVTQTFRFDGRCKWGLTPFAARQHLGSGPICT